MSMSNTTRAIKRAMSAKKDQSFLTIGHVIDTNDPQQMGRVRAICPAFGDTYDMTINNVPWCMYVSPLGGVVSMGTRGSESTNIDGTLVSYGMWNIPKVGAYVLVGCLDGDRLNRFYVGCVHSQYATHTMPHGRYTYSDGSTGAPDGPLDTKEKPIEPLYSNLKKQFTKVGNYHQTGTPSDPHKNLEWRTRGADTQVSAITPEHLKTQDSPGSKIADHKFDDFEYTAVREEDGGERKFMGVGYGLSQIEPNDRYESTGSNYDSMVYSWTTPGFHSISMDDRSDNSRIRIRTISGHQIIMDDTNERIYINTSGGDSWVELDKVGNIDIYSKRDISTHAGGDINFTCDKAFKVKAGNGIHFISDTIFRIHSHGDASIKSDQGYSIESNTKLNLKCSGGGIFMESSDSLNIKSGSTLNLSSSGSMNLKSSSSIHIDSGSSINLIHGSQLFLTGPGTLISGPPPVSGPPGQSAQSAASAESAKFSYYPSRIPDHEPWGRTYSDPSLADNDTSPNTFKAKSTYSDKSNGKVDREGTPYGRGNKWHR